MNSKMFNTTVLSPADFQSLIVMPGHQDTWIRSNSMLVRKQCNKFDVYTALSQKTDGDQLLQSMLRDETTRSEFASVISSFEGLHDVMVYLFGKSANVNYNVPKYASADVLAAVAQARGYKTAGSRTQVLIAAVLNDMLDVFKMRIISSEISWVYENSSVVSPSLDDVVDELLEVSAADKVATALKKFVKTVEKEIPSKQFDISSFTHVIHATLRDISIALDQLTYKATWIRDVFHLLGAYVTGNKSHLIVYGDIRANGGIQALSMNATLCRLAVKDFKASYTCTIPAHELNDEIQFVTRNMANLSSFEVVTTANSIIGVQGYRRAASNTLLSVLISGKRQINPNISAYFVADHKALGMDNVDIENRTTKLKAYLPQVPSGILSNLTALSINVEEEDIFNKNKAKLDRLIIGEANVSDELLHDVASLTCDVMYSIDEVGKVEITYIFNDKEGRLNALSPSSFQNVSVSSALLAIAGTYALDDVEIKLENQFLNESIAETNRFSGVWPQRDTKSIDDFKITIDDILSDKENKMVESFSMSVFATSPNLTRTIEMQVNEGWAGINTLLNNMADVLNKSGAQRSQMQRSRWTTNVITLLVDWAYNDIAIHSLVNRAREHFAIAAQKAGLSEEYLRVSSYYTGMIALQVVVEVLNVLGGEGTGKVALNENVIRLLYSTEAIMAMGHSFR